MGFRSRLTYIGRGALTSDALPMKQRVRLLRRLGATVGADFDVWPSRFIHPENLTVGDRVFINYDCVIESRGPLVIEDDVSLGPRVMILTTSHEPGPPNRRAGNTHEATTRIGAGAWVGAGAVVLPGVTVGGGCMIAAASVVTEDCEPDGLYVGSPARRVRDLHSGSREGVELAEEQADRR